MHAPLVSEIERIAALKDPVIRNLLITNCYCELSGAMALRTGYTANWCTFATWASKQAGQTIRGEDMRKKMEEVLGNDAGISEIISWIAWFVKKSGSSAQFESIRQSTIAKFISSSVAQSSDAVGRGNKKVFEEIGWQFAQFLSACGNDIEFNQPNITRFCEQLRPGEPPDGQQLLRNAFTRYYQSFFESDAKKRNELRFLANLEVGFHEQTRLQPEIREALDAAVVNPAIILEVITAALSQKGNFWKRLFVSLKMVIGKSPLLKEKVNELAMLAGQRMRAVITEQLMTLTIPPSNCLYLAKDLSMNYPEVLMQPENQDLILFLGKIDPTPDSLTETGAIDWSDLNERLHFIADLFRCLHESEAIFEQAFSSEDLAAIREGRVPAYL